jgi:catechol 2,3-dioxygenase-like lactoylglutathione lyase family enzyme
MDKENVSLHRTMSRIGHIWIPVSSLARSVAFYTEKLGMEMKFMVRAGEEFEPGQKAKESFAQLETKDKNVLVMLVERPKALPARGGAIIGFLVNNLDTVKAEFEKNGVEIIGPMAELADRRFIHFRDPDGHLFQLGQIM